MRFTKTVVAVLVAVPLWLALAGCDDSDQTTGGGPRLGGIPMPGLVCDGPLPQDIDGVPFPGLYCRAGR